MTGFSVVIPSRTASNLIPCVTALVEREPDLAPAQIIVVDDGLAPEAKAALPGVWWVQGQKPFVFARNVNIGIRAAGRDDVVLLNDDALLETPKGFSVLAQAAREHPEVGIISAACNNVGNRNQLPKSIGLRAEDRMVCFIAVYIPQRTLARVGELDERYTGYGLDDDDYCLRVRKAGMQIAIHDGCFVDHAKLHSTYRGSGHASFQENLALFKQKWGHDNWGAV